MPHNSFKDKAEAFTRLLKIMDDLREKCPWDRKQTIHSLRSLTIEETYELADSIADNDWKGLKEEIGDVLLHLIFYAKIGEEQGKFDIADAIHAECEKLIYRHPHIYGDVKVENEEDVKRNWEQLKLKEGKKSVLAGVPRALPAIIKSFRMQEKAAKVGFDWETKEQVWDKVQEEIGELKEKNGGLRGCIGHTYARVVCLETWIREICDLISTLSDKVCEDLLRNRRKSDGRRSHYRDNRNDRRATRRSDDRCRRGCG
ncbi:MAG: hypothetical protein RIS64_4126 [Bacteroidota bacterium]